MGIQAMVSSLKNNNRRKARVPLFKKKVLPTSTSNCPIHDSVEMKTFEYAEFQKKLFHQKRKDRKKTILLSIVTAIITFLIILFFLRAFGYLSDHSYLFAR